eukprot:TRINITY_DN4098_c0_g1_i2.p1 TRINITY_DN4098_c0_g1~~TRINITY_DN4098_c0_g1_i2.p1  ORF type:complete len:476 (+),score=50.51 TRINITY_DN4098_c0_g1_i2:127-1554(+)
MAQMQVGDWFCPACGDLQFARNASCRQCGVDKPIITTSGKGGGKKGGKGGRKADTPRDEMVDGDWTCTSCGDFQFARNRTCRKCGALNPSLAPAPKPSSQQDMRDGDWTCPQCGDHVFARNDNCRRCGSGKLGSSRQEVKEGDWMCPNCGDHVFARNDNCRRCGSGKLASNRQEVKEGDWMCPNCGDHVFARNDNCRRCGTGRLPSNGQEVLDGDWTCPKCGDHVFARNDNCRLCGYSRVSSNGQEVKEGDWTCRQCGDHVFARNDACRRCGAPRSSPGGVRDRSMSGAGYGKSSHRSKGNHDDGPYGGGASKATHGKTSHSKGQQTSKGGGEGKGAKAEDWVCANCGDLQFGRNSVCRMCGTVKDAVPVAPSTNDQEPRDGDWNCPTCGDLVFGRNSNCRLCGTAKPGARPTRASEQKTFVPSSRRSSSDHGGKGKRQEARPGDWHCPACNDLQFARNPVCRQCGEPKPDEDED